MKKAVSILMAAALLLGLVGGTATAQETRQLYNDVPNNSWYADAVYTLQASGIMAGDGKGNFMPNNQFTRLEAAAILAKLDGADLSGYKTSGFNDVPNGKWYTPAVAWASARGFISGDGKGNFMPGRLITRQEMAVLLDNYIKIKGIALSPASKGAPFADDALINTWAREQVYRLRDAGIINGRPGNRFDPRGYMLRAEIAQLFANFLVATGGNAPVTIKWCLFDYATTAYYRPLIAAYTAMNPWVTIEVVDLPNNGDFMYDMATRLSGGADYDVLTIRDNMPGYANLIKQNRLEPLSGYGINKSLYNGVLEQISVGGEFYALPFKQDFWVLYYNKDIFDAADVAYPTNDMTMEEYDALARRLTSGSGANKIYGAHYHGWRSASSLFSILDGQHTIVDGNYNFMKPTYEMVTKQQDDGIVMTLADIRASSMHYTGAFYSGQIAMLNMGTWFIPPLITACAIAEIETPNAWGIVKYPHPAGVAAGTTLGTITSLAVNKNSGVRRKEVAIDFMKFVCGDKGAAVLASVGHFPAVKNDMVVNLLASMAGFPGDANSKEALKVNKVYLEMPMHDKCYDIETILIEEHECILLGEKSIDDAIAAMNARVAALG
ncbi:MAG: extracellular solute-binding protein [Oscillospiraceae bacterium]|nr:extracellular solute-binding protein [Oscillospiraceae bacterium]